VVHAARLLRNRHHVAARSLPCFAQRTTVIRARICAAPWGSAKPAAGYDKKTMAWTSTSYLSLKFDR